MDSYVKKALENHDKGYNCAQAVICAFAEKTNLDEGTLFKLTEGFGAGMGNRRNTCGALSGAVMLAGLLISSGDPENKTKFDTYKKAGEIAAEFEKRCKATVCQDIKGAKNGAPTVSCNDCIRIATELAQEILIKNNIFGIQK